MAVTTQQQEYKRLRSYLNPYIQGKNVDAVLNALAAGSSTYLVNNAAAVNDSLYITTATGVYLDQLLSAYGIERPSDVGLSDPSFRQIGIQVKNRKQVRDLLNNILNIMFGDELTKASNDSTVVEPYDLADGDTLIINFDENHTVTVTFTTAQFENIAAATAQEVADAITETISSMGYSGIAISNNNGEGNYVELLSNTIGPASSVTVLGGSAQNQLRFPTLVSAGGDSATQWTMSLQPGGLVRFTWTGGTNPLVGEVSIGNYVNVYGGGFLNSGYEGTYTIVEAVGGGVGDAYFEVENILAPAPSGPYVVITQGGTVQDPAILFFNPTREVLASLHSYAAIYQTQGDMLQIFLPVATQVNNRTRIGSAHLHDAPREIYTFIVNPNPGDAFNITTVNTLIAGTDFAIGATFQETIVNLAVAVNAITGLVAVPGQIDPTIGPRTAFTESLTASAITNGGLTITFSSPAVDPILPGDRLTMEGITAIVETVISQSEVIVNSPGFPVAFDPIFATPPLPALLIHEAYYILTIFQDIPSITLVGTYTGAAAISGSGLIGDPLSVQPNQPGPYMYDLTQPFTVSAINTTLTQELDGTDSRVFTVADSTNFPNSLGYLVFDYGFQTQEGPVPYVGRPSDGTLIISPTYTIKNPHLDGSSVSLVAYRGSVVITEDGLDYPFYLTDVVAGRIYCQELIESVAAAGINVVFTILYPNDIGLGKWGTLYTENPIIWGENSLSGDVGP